MKWTIVAFKHPEDQKSVYYRQNVVDLDVAIAKAIKKGANLISIRGFED